MCSSTVNLEAKQEQHVLEQMLEFLIEFGDKNQSEVFMVVKLSVEERTC